MVTDSGTAGIVRTGQIIVLSMAAGVVFFGGFLMLNGLGGNAQPVSLLPEVAAALSVAMVVASFAVPRMLHAKNLRAIAAGSYRPPANRPVSGEPATLASSRLTSLIIGCAILEGGAFLNLVAYMTNGQTLSIAVASALVLVLLARFPLPITWEQNIAEDQRQLNEERHLVG